MPHIVTEPCIGVKDKSCVEQCPVEAFYEGEDQVYINPEECIDCGACVAVCPVAAIFATDDVPDNMKPYIQKAVMVFQATHAANCKCGQCDRETHAAKGQLSKAQPKKS
jgi:NAD-dependent dihydropyrimidine dehydrogenase PreA subunit